MYVPPKGQIILYSNVPLKPEYEHTILFKTKSLQNLYFVLHNKFVLNNQLYTRKEMGIIKVNKPIEDLTDVTYMSFNNDAPNGSPSNNSRTYYCFITHIEYCNENVSYIYFSIDLFQTYLFDWTLKPSYIERTHIDPWLDDSLSNYNQTGNFPILPEHIEIGDYEYKEPTLYTTSGDHVPTQLDHLFDDFVYVVAATFDTNLDNTIGGLQNGFYTGLVCNVFTSVNDVNQFIYNATVANKADGIVNVFMAPRMWASHPQINWADIHILTSTFRDAYQARAGNNGYMPHNGKMFTSPYCKIIVTDNDGTTAEYMPDQFTSKNYIIINNQAQLTFELNGVCVCAGSNEIGVYPKNYKGLVDNYNEQIVMNVTPQCAYATDSYRAWLAQNASKMGVERSYAYEMNSLQNAQIRTNAQYNISDTSAATASAIAQGAVNTVGNVLKLNVTGAMNTAIQTATTGVRGQMAIDNIAYNAAQNQRIVSAQTNRAISLLNAEESVARTVPPQAHGNASGMSGTVLGSYKVSFYIAIPNYKMTKKIDEYFDMYGYKVDMLAVPNYKTRKYWNYIKCASFNADTTTIPGDDYDTIKKIFERGITFWHDPLVFLDYSQDNHQGYVEPT